MPLNLSQIHKWKKVGPGRAVVDQVVPTARVSHANPPDKNGLVMYDPPIWIQDGKMYSEGGQAVKKPPFYFWQEVEKWSPEYRSEMKIDLPKDWDKQKKDMAEKLEAKEKKNDG